MEVRERDDGLIVVNDAYNANPASMVAALDALAGIGARTRPAHGRGTGGDAGARRRTPRSRTARSGGPPRRLGIDVVVVVGEAARGIAEGLGDAEWDGTVVPTAGRDEALEWVRKNVAAEDVVLVKASRGVALEVVADDLLEGGTGAP